MSSRSSPAWRRWELGTLALIVGLGAWLRWPMLTRGIVGDEQALLQYRGLEGFWRDSLSTMHPPLYRMSIRMFLDPLAAVQVGRLSSLFAGLALIAMMAVVGRKILGSRMAGLVAAFWCAVLPVSILWSALFRPYSVWMLLVALHLWAVMRWLDTDAGLKAWAWMPVLLTALLLPQVHYMSVPWLVVFALSLVFFGQISWRRLWVYVPSALLFLPLCWFILAPQFSTRRRQSGDLFRSWEWLFGMGLASNGVDVPDLSLFSLFVLLVMALGWRWLPTPIRVCMLGGLSIFVGVTLSVSQHALTSSTRLLGVVFWIPLMVNFPLLLRRWWPRWTVGIAIAALGMFACIVPLHLELYDRDIRTLKANDRLATFLESWEQWVPDGYDVGFVFPADQRVARLVITNSLNGSKAEPGCGSDKYCFVIDDHIWKKVSPKEIPPKRPSVLVWTRSLHPEKLPDGCASLQSGPTVPDIVRCDRVVH